MSSIDEVIARSRQPGQFQERKTFTVARGRAIQKLRQFALVDPHFYILELIQSAVSNGATYIDIQCDKRSVALSYVGGNFRQQELAQLFDFLFASRDDVEHGPLRQLALGVNALMLFRPEEIIIETGDGTQRGTHRVEICGDDTVEIGRPEQALNGTYLRATGLRGNRKTLRDGKPREFRVVEERCLTAPVPILFNHEPVFGYSRQRTPKSLFGFTRTLSFDEGDFYGAIGIARRRSGAVFRLLTHGVWIESMRHNFGARRIENVGGVIAFDGLRKTADHSSIVEDERLHEMWLRLLPHVERLLRGDDGDDLSTGYDVRTMANIRLETPQLIELLRTSPTVVAVAPRIFNNEEYFERARQIGASLDAPVVAVAAKDRGALKGLAGRDVNLHFPDLSSGRELHFYTSDPVEMPPRPWLVSPVDLGGMSLVEVGQYVTQRVSSVHKNSKESALKPWENSSGLPELFARVDEDELLDREMISGLRGALWLLGRSGDLGNSLVELKEELDGRHGEAVLATVYTPVNQGGAATENLEVRTARRVVWSGESDVVIPGQKLIVEVSGLPLPLLWSKRGEDKALVAEYIARAVVAKYVTQLEGAAHRALRAALRADLEPGSNAARLVFASLANRVVKRIRSRDDGGQGLSFSLVDHDLDVSILEIELLRTLNGDGVSVRGLEELMAQCRGLVYAVRADVDADLEGLDRSRILVVDEALESVLVSLVGPTAYVRVDRRDVLAEYDGVRVRDMAIELRDYPEFPLLVEGSDPSRWPRQRQLEVMEKLFSQLADLVRGEAANPDDQEDRRQAWRHLQWFALHRPTFEEAADLISELDNLPLFRLAGDRTCSLFSLRFMLEKRGQVEMLDGWAVGAGELSFEEARSQQVFSEDKLDPCLLTMNPFVLHLLGDGVEGTAEYHLSQQEIEGLGQMAQEQEVMLESQKLDDHRFSGVVGLPRVVPKRAAVVVFGADEKEVVLRDDLGAQFGVVGKVRLRRGVAHQEVADDLEEVARDVMGHLLARIPELSVRGGWPYERALEGLLYFAGRHLQLVARSDMTVKVGIHDRLAREILNAPIFAARTGLLVSMMSVIREFRDAASRSLVRQEALAFSSAVLSDGAPDVVRQWIEATLTLDNLSRPAGRQEDKERSSRGESGRSQQGRGLAERLGYWLEELHPTTNYGAGREKRYLVEVCNGEEISGRLDEEFCQLMRTGDWERPDRLLINGDHWLAKWLDADGEDSSQALAWALLAAYGHINNVLEGIENDHELIFQQRLARAMVDGRLDRQSGDPGEQKGSKQITEVMSDP